MQVDGKIATVGYFAAGCFLVLAWGLTDLQILQGEHYQKLSQNNRIRRVALSAPRGLLQTVDGSVLAGNRPSYDVELVLDEVGDLGTVAEGLEHILDIPAEDILRRVKKGRYLPYLPVIVARDVGVEKLTRLLEGMEDLSGINVGVRPMREYPQGDMAAHVLGSLGRISPEEYKKWKPYGYGPQDIIGKTGLEQAFNASLVGKAGGMQVQVDSRGNKDRVLGRKLPVRGTDRNLTLDLALQEAAEKELKGRQGAIVAMDPHTGSVLAMASGPSFHPSIFVESGKEEERAQILKDARRPLVNRAISGYYPPGSVFKAVVAMAGLASGTLDRDTVFFCPGSAQIGDRVFHCWKEQGHGNVDLREALKVSCNIFFYRSSFRIGHERIAALAKAAGFGRAPNSGLPYEGAGLVPDAAWKRRKGLGAWTQGDTANLSIGQGYLLVTPLQMAAFASLLAKDGGRSRAHLVQEYRSMGQFHPGPQIAQEHWDFLKEGLVAAVNERGGTGYAAHVQGLEIAGKTGTAQTSSDRKLKKDHAWFVGFAPASSPRIALAVLLEHAGSGGAEAAPVARRLLGAYLAGNNVDG